MSTRVAVAMVRGGFEFQGQKVLGGNAGLVPVDLGGSAISRGAMINDIQELATRPTPQLHGRGDSTSAAFEKMQRVTSSTAGNGKIWRRGKTDGKPGLLHQPDDD